VALWKYLLQQAITFGDCYQTPEQMEQAALKLLDTENPDIAKTALDQARPTLEQQQEFVWTPPDGVVPTGRWALRGMDKLERLLADRVLTHTQAKTSGPKAMVDWQWMDDHIGIRYAPQQQQAVAEAIAAPFSIITGGPGTGKTTILRGILAWLMKHEEVNPEHVALAAPTARAAKRMEEVTGHSAMTIHRLLEVAPPHGFQHNADNPLDIAYLIVDEVSMVDLPLAWALWQAVGPDTRVIWVGDENQLPSVGPGAVLKDFIQSGQFPVYRLAQNFRSTSGIVTNAYRVLTGVPPIRTDEYWWKEYPRGQDKGVVRERLLSLIPQIQSHWGCHWQDIQVLAPIRRGLLGTEALNQELRDLLNPKGSEPDWVGAFGRTFRLGDRVTQTRNNYRKNVFNGDIGYVVLIDRPTPGTGDDEQDPPESQIHVQYGDEVVTYKPDETRELVLAYATTVHKSQGAEYPVIIIPLFWDAYMMLYRNLLYTAMTRAKSRVILLSEEGVMGYALRTVEGKRRQTLLSARLQGR
jgi:exodeoxyribonuclease V alpha subunit